LKAEKIVEFIKQVALFENLEIELLNALALKMKEKIFKKREIIFRENDIGDKLYVLISGKIVLSKEMAHEKQNVIAVITPVNVIGEMAILDNEPRSLTVKAVQESKFLILDKNDFKEIILKHPEIAFQIFKILSQRLRQANVNILNKRNNNLKNSK
jgi:CRP-like cAMP-binding protein